MPGGSPAQRGKNDPWATSTRGRGGSLSTGASGGGLGASWSGLLGACWHKVIFDIFLSILERFGGPNGPPEEPKMELNIDQN